MKSIHTENELKEFIEIYTGKKVNKECKNYLKALEWLNDKRRGYRIIDSISDALFWLKDGNYSISNFSGGLGLTMKHGGGCWGYFEDGLLEKMSNEDFIYFNKDTGNFGGIKQKGYAILADES